MRQRIEHLRQTRAASEPSNQPSDRTNTHTGAVSTAICPSEDWQDKIAANYVVGVDLQCDCQRRGLRRVEELAQTGRIKKVLVHSISRLARRSVSVSSGRPLSRIVLGRGRLLSCQQPTAHVLLIQRLES